MLHVISPIDGRYQKTTQPLAEFFSEAGFIRYRVVMETKYLEALLVAIGKKGKKIKLEVTDKDLEAIKKIEATTNHDLKAIEYWMKSKLNTEWLHFGLTSEDATNIAYALMITDALKMVLIPSLKKILNMLHASCSMFHDTPMLARTHGQPASPTTFGKEMAVFASRLERQLSQLKSWKVPAKLNGATGNYNALAVAFPKIDWMAFSKKFITSLGLEPNLVTTQIESHDGMIELFDIMRRINMILIDLDQDIWRYVSDGWLKQKAVQGEVGSSTMPHKINPIKFENSEGNLGLANALFAHFAQKLPVSRLQRDLTDSTVKRSIGSAFAYSLIGYQALLDGLGRVDVDIEAMRSALAEHPEVLAEAIQTILRREGIPMPYEQLKEFTRGRTVTLEDLQMFIKNLKIKESTKKELLALSPENYIGLANKIASWQK